MTWHGSSGTRTRSCCSHELGRVGESARRVFDDGRVGRAVVGDAGRAPSRTSAFSARRRRGRLAAACRARASGQSSCAVADHLLLRPRRGGRARPWPRASTSTWSSSAKRSFFSKRARPRRNVAVAARQQVLLEEGLEIAERRGGALRVRPRARPRCAGAPARSARRGRCSHRAISPLFCSIAVSVWTLAGRASRRFGLRPPARARPRAASRESSRARRACANARVTSGSRPSPMRAV